jgi:hypothetical protein
MPAAKNPRHVKMASSCDAALQVLDPPSESTNHHWESPMGGFAHPRPRRFARIPTHVVGVANDRRFYPRAKLHLPLSLRRIAGQREPLSSGLKTVDISSSGVFFLFPRAIEPGTPLDLVVRLLDRPRGRGSVRMCTEAHVVRLCPVNEDGLYGLGVTFDDIAFDRDEPIPLRVDGP